MSDIERIIIENFQSHEYSVLQFSKGLNVITGPSDQGKSAILRALKWVLYNEPRGTDFIRHGTSTAKVTVEMSNGFKIARERSKSKNKYTVINPDGVSTVFEGFGNEVPEEVVKIHGIPRVVLDTDLRSSLNIADQLEAPFLLSETGAVRAKAIGRLTGVHIIDNAIREVMVDIRRENQSRERVSSELDETLSKLKDYENIRIIEQRLDQSEKILSKLYHLIERKQKLEIFYSRIKELHNEHVRIRDILNRIGNVEVLDDIVRECETKTKKLNQIRRLAQNLALIDADLKDAADVMDRTTGLNSAFSILSEIERKNVRLNKLLSADIAYKKLEDEQLKACRILQSTESAANIASYLKKAEIENSRLLKLFELKGKLIEIGVETSKIEKYFDKTQTVENVDEMISQIYKKIELLKTLIDVKQQYDAITNFIDDGRKYLENNKKQLHELLENYSENLKKAGKCPMCNSIINEEKIHDIIKLYEEAH